MLGSAPGAGSDAHTLRELGSVYVEMENFDGAQDFYRRTLRKGIEHRRFVIGVFFSILVATGFLFWFVPKGFLPVVRQHRHQEAHEFPPVAQLRPGQVLKPLRQLRVRLAALRIFDDRHGGE